MTTSTFFAVNLDTGLFEAHGVNPAWTGTDARNLHECIEGHALVQEMIDQAKSKGTGVVGLRLAQSGHQCRRAQALLYPARVPYKTSRRPWSHATPQRSVVFLFPRR
jgi:hypothetical protein